MNSSKKYQKNIKTMKEFRIFCNEIKKIIENQSHLDIELARDVISKLNEYLYTNYSEIGTIEKFGTTFDFFSDFHKFWHTHHKEILGCVIDETNCEKVADVLHDVYLQTNTKAFKSLWDTCGLSNEDVCRIRMLTANQDFRGSRKFSDFVNVFNDDYTIFDENKINDTPDKFLSAIGISKLSQNDKRVDYAKNIANFILSHNCSPFEIIDKYNRNIFDLRTALINNNLGYGNKKADMFLRDMVILGIWSNVEGFEKINVASDVNTIKVALRTGIIQTKIPLVSSFLDIFCYQYEYIDEINAKAWRKVWEIWSQKYPNEKIDSPCLLDYFIYNVVGKQFCKETLAIFKGDNCDHVFKWHSGRNKTCQTCHKQGNKGQTAHVINKVLPCCDEEGYIAILQSEYVKRLPEKQKIKKCPFIDICTDKKHLMPPKSISIMGQTGWTTAYSKKGEGGGGLMA